MKKQTGKIKPKRKPSPKEFGKKMEMEKEKIEGEKEEFPIGIFEA